MGSSIIWWIIGTLGVGGSIVALVLFPAVAQIIFAFLRTRVGQIVAGILFVLSLIFGGIVYGRVKGRAEERENLKARATLEVANAAAERARIDRLTDDEIDKELSKWDRK